MTCENCESSQDLVDEIIKKNAKTMRESGCYNFEDLNSVKYSVIYKSLQLFHIIYPIDLLPKDVQKFMQDELKKIKRRDYEKMFKEN